MRRAQVVIGANFGDEGKGLATDYLASGYAGDSLVVRFNGGAQAGHTVVAPDGRRHVFGHFGSGTFSDSATFLSRFFVSNPILFLRELAQLNGLGLSPRVIVDPSGLVTTPYDMMLNQHIELVRAGGRHGSCGVGFGETIQRSDADGFRITVDDLRFPNNLRDRLNAIRRHYVSARLAVLGINSVPEYLLSDEVLDRFIEDCACFVEAIELADCAVLRKTDNLIFEGAQGLMLDMDEGYWPHVTRSYTGLRNVLELADASGIDRLDVHYVTRAYLTRHGMGPLPNELDSPPGPNIRDDTNQANAWQGALRFALHDLDIFKGYVARDVARACGLDIRHHVLVTCLDQMADTIEVMQGGKKRCIDTRRFSGELRAIVGANSAMESWGPSRSTLFAERKRDRSLIT